MTNLVIPAPPPAVAETAIVSSTFWPSIDPAKVREAQRIDATVTSARLRGALIEAIATTNTALLAWRSAQQAAGFATLAEVPAETIDTESLHLHRYRRAVGSLAKALLLERLRDFDATGKGDKDAAALTDPIDDCRRDWHAAVADIAGRPRSTVELI